MNARQYILPAGEALANNAGKVKIMMVCENHFAGIDVVGALGELAECKGAGREMSIENVWSLAMLEEPRLREMAAVEAARADVILVWIRGRGGLPDGVRKWLNAWVGNERSSAQILVVLLNEPEGDGWKPYPIATYLEQCARLGEMKCLVREVGDYPGLEEFGLPGAGERTLQTARTIEQILERCRGMVLSARLSGASAVKSITQP